MCVNALKGATFISTKESKCIWRSIIMCQCPERGDLHFHGQRGRALITTSSYCVNALKGATFISTIEGIEEPVYSPFCVNALKGATFISTIFYNN